MTKPPRLSVIIPVNHTFEALPLLLESLRQHLEPNDEIIIVDTTGAFGSVDQPVAHDSVRIVRTRSTNQIGTAIKKGIRTANGNTIVIFEPGSDHDPADLPNLLQQTSRYTMVVNTTCARLGSTIQTYTRRVTGFSVPDFTSGFRVIDGNVARKFAYLLPSSGAYTFALTLTLLRAGLTIGYQQAATNHDPQPTTVRASLSFAATLTQMTMLYLPLRVFIPISVFLILLGSGYIAARLILASHFSGMGGTVLSIGVLTFMLGLIFEQIALLRYSRSENQ